MVEFVNPEDLRGAKLLMLEGADESEIYFKSGEFSKVKRIGGVARAASLFESDFSYEDFQHLQGFSSPGKSKRIEDAMVGDRPAYVVQTRPAEAANSAYESIVTAVDTTPPDITMSLDPDTLWPPNHKLVEIHATVTVSDICDPNPTFILASTSSSEPDDARTKAHCHLTARP